MKRSIAIGADGENVCAMLFLFSLCCWKPTKNEIEKEEEENQLKKHGDFLASCVNQTKDQIIYYIDKKSEKERAREGEWRATHISDNNKILTGCDFVCRNRQQVWVNEVKEKEKNDSQELIIILLILHS